MAAAKQFVKRRVRLASLTTWKRLVELRRTILEQERIAAEAKERRAAALLEAEEHAGVLASMNLTEHDGLAAFDADLEDRDLTVDGLVPYDRGLRLSLEDYQFRHWIRGLILNADDGS